MTGSNCRLNSASSHKLWDLNQRPSRRMLKLRNPNSQTSIRTVSRVFR